MVPVAGVMTIRRLASRTDLCLALAMQGVIVLGGIYLIARFVIEPALIPVAIIIPGQKAAAPKVARPVIDVSECPNPLSRGSDA